MGHPRRRHRHSRRLGTRKYPSLPSRTLLSVVDKIYKQLETRLVPLLSSAFEEADLKNESRKTTVTDGSIPLVTVEPKKSSKWLTTTGQIARVIIAAHPSRSHWMEYLNLILSDLPAPNSCRAFSLRDALSSLDDPLESAKISITGKSLLGYDFDFLPAPVRFVDPLTRRVKRMQRIRGYRDKGNLAPSSEVTIRRTRTEAQELWDLKRSLDEFYFISHTSHATEKEQEQMFTAEFGQEVRRSNLENALAVFLSENRT